MTTTPQSFSQRAQELADQARELAATGDIRGAQNAYETFIIGNAGTIEADLARLADEQLRDRLTEGIRRALARAEDADLVLWYVRTRKTTSDFARNRRQQEIIIAIFEKMLSMNAIKRAPEFYQIYKDNVTTSLPLTNLLPLLPLAASLTDGSQINHYYVKGKQVTSWVTPGGAQVLLPNRDRIKNVLKKAMVGQR